MSDITKCLGVGCLDKDNCYRFTAPSSNYQSWSDFYKKDEKCQHYLSIKPDDDWNEKRIDIIGQNGNIGYD